MDRIPGTLFIGKVGESKRQLQIIPGYDILAEVNDHGNEEVTCGNIRLQRYGDGGLLLCR
jgi:hypothetical protein